MRALWTELKRALGSVGFAAGVIGAFAAAAAGGLGILLEAFDENALMVTNVATEAAYGALTSQAFMLTAPIFCTFAYTSAFADELKSKFVREYLPRSGRLPYLFSKTFATGLSGGLSVFLGCAAFIGACFALAPASGEAAVYGVPVEIVLKGAALIFLNGFLWALAGGISSAVSMNKYMGYACPFIFYYIMTAFRARYYRGAVFLDPSEWMNPGSMAMGTAAVLVAALIVALFAVYMLVMKRRLNDA